MNFYQKGLLIISKHKENNDENIADFWFNNKKELLEKIYLEDLSFRGNTSPLEEFEVKLRWESEIGKILRKKIINYIKGEQHKTSLKIQTNFKSKIFDTLISNLDFNNLFIEFNSNKIWIKDFNTLFKSNSFRVGSLDLRGIDLSEIKLNLCQIKGVDFSYSNFSDSIIQQTFLEKVNLSHCNLSNSHFSGVRLSQNTNINNCDFSGSYVDFSTDKDFFNINYNKISYFNLVKHYFYNNVKSRPFTEFALFKDDINKCQDIETKLYIIWLQNTLKKIKNKDNQSKLTNLGLFFEIALTKYWSSYKVLFFCSLIINLIFSFIYFFLKDNFYISNDLINVDNYFIYLYYSVITFTTLGYGDIIPNSTLLRGIVIFEVIVGYIILGILVFLLSNKISNKLNN